MDKTISVDLTFHEWQSVMETLRNEIESYESESDTIYIDWVGTLKPLKAKINNQVLKDYQQNILDTE